MNSNYHIRIDIENSKLSSLLSVRQRQILYYVILGKYSKEIAKILGLSYRTIQHYVENIKIKMNVDSRSELIEKAIQISNNDEESN